VTKSTTPLHSQSHRGEAPGSPSPKPLMAFPQALRPRGPVAIIVLHHHPQRLAFIGTLNNYHERDIITESTA